MKPLWTGPKPPSPKKLLEEKLCVMILSSASEKTWRLDPTKETDRSSESVEPGKLKSMMETLLEEEPPFVATSLVVGLGEGETDSLLKQLEKIEPHPIVMSVTLMFFLQSDKSYAAKVMFFWEEDVSLRKIDRDGMVEMEKG